jgi:hypothetical protein
MSLEKIPYWVLVKVTAFVNSTEVRATTSIALCIIFDVINVLI